MRHSRSNVGVGAGRLILTELAVSTAIAATDQVARTACVGRRSDFFGDDQPSSSRRQRNSLVLPG